MLFWSCSIYKKIKCNDRNKFYFPTLRREGERYVHSYKKAKMTQHTHTNQDLHIRQTLCQEQALYLHVHVYVCIVCAKHFVYNSCLFSSPEPKAQVSFSDQNLSVVRRCRLCRCCCCRCRRKLFTFSSSSPEPLGQFQPNLAQSILGWRGFKFVQMKGRALFQGEIITK